MFTVSRHTISCNLASKSANISRIPFALLRRGKKNLYKKESRCLRSFPQTSAFAFHRHSIISLHRGFSRHFNLLYHDCTILACSFMKQRGVLCPLKFEKACSRKDLRAFMLLYRFMKSGQILPIPNFIVFRSP